MSGISDLISNLEAASTAFEETWSSIGGVADGTYSMLSEDVGGLNGTTLNVGFLEDLADVRVQSRGESKTIDGARAYKGSYELEVLYAAISLARRDVQYDPSGRVGRMLAQFARRSADIMDARFWEKWNANPTGVDGVALFSASHPVGGSTASNKTTAALSHASYRAAKAGLRGQARENGEPYGLNCTHLFCHPDEEDIAKEVTGADKPVYFNNTGAEATSAVVGGIRQANVFQGDSLVVVTPRVTSGDWFIADRSTPGVGPWVHAFGEMPTAKTVDTSDNESVLKMDEYTFCVQGDVAQGPGHWQTVYGKNS